MPYSQQFLPEGGCCTRDPGELCVALWEHPSSGSVIQTRSGFVGGGKVGIPDLPSFVHQCSRHPVKAQGGWAASPWPAKHLSLPLRFVFFFLKLGPDYTGKHPCWAGQAGWVCPAAGRGGLWQPVQQLLASCWPGVLLCSAVVCNSQLLSSFSSGLGWGWQLLGWLGRCFYPGSLWSLQVPAGARLQDLSSSAHSCPELAAWTTNRLLFLRTCQTRNGGPNAAQPKE